MVSADYEELQADLDEDHLIQELVRLYGDETLPADGVEEEPPC